MQSFHGMFVFVFVSHLLLAVSALSFHRYRASTFSMALVSQRFCVLSVVFLMYLELLALVYFPWKLGIISHRPIYKCASVSRPKNSNLCWYSKQSWTGMWKCCQLSLKNCTCFILICHILSKNSDFEYFHFFPMAKTLWEFYYGM